jgi:hypothetical protein
MLAAMLSMCSRFSGYAPRPGDIVFQDLISDQSQALKLATGSDYTHCGIVFELNGDFVVYEAVGPVRMIPLQEWIRQGVNGHIVAMRVDTLYRYLTDRALGQMRFIAERHVGKPYDPVFNWSDDQMYCSELVWKVYYEGLGLELAPLRRLGSYQLDHPLVLQKLAERYGDSIPLNEPVISPADLIESDRLEIVYQN